MVSLELVMEVQKARDFLPGWRDKDRPGGISPKWVEVTADREQGRKAFPCSPSACEHTHAPTHTHACTHTQHAGWVQNAPSPFHFAVLIFVSWKTEIIQQDFHP